MSVISSSTATRTCPAIALHVARSVRDTLLKHVLATSMQPNIVRRTEGSPYPKYICANDVAPRVYVVTTRATKAWAMLYKRISTKYDTTSSMQQRDATIQFGPAHPAAHGVLRCVLTMRGEHITGSIITLGLLHRGTEKLMEQRTANQSTMLLLRA